MIRPKLPFPLVAALLILFAVPALIEQARDVDVLLYMAAAARANDAGTLPYASAWIEKGPLAMGLFQAAAAVFGRYSFLGLGLVWTALALAGAWLARELAREAGASWSDGWAALLFGVSIGAVGGTLNTEVPALVLAAGACLSLLRRRLFLAGVLTGAAFLCRQNVGVLWPVFIVCEAAPAWRARRTWRDAAGRAARISFGFLAPCAVVAALYAASGAWEEFLFCFWRYNTSIYVAATHVTPMRLVRLPWDVALNFLWPVRTTVVLALLGGVAAWRDRRAVRILGAVILVSLAAMIPGLRLFTHYAAVIVPFAAALGAIGLEWVMAHARTRGALALALVAFALGTEVAERGWRDAGGSLRRWIAREGWRHPNDPLQWPGRDETVVPVATYLRDNAAPGDRVFVWGTRPHFPVYADLLPATRFVTCTFLTGLVPWERVAPYEDTTRWIVPGSWELLAHDLRDEAPRFIVDASADHLFADGAYAPARFPELQSILDASYEVVFKSEGRDGFVVWRRR
jgi:hypothetical protein